MKIIKTSKGLEMPIQVFIVLFVLLAVAMLVLQMVSQQFQQQTEQMKKEEMKRAYQQRLGSMKETCSSLCQTANSEGTLASKAAYCAKSFTQGLDITQNALTQDYTEKFLVGIGICEDQLYCFHIYPCEVGTAKLNAKKCIEILCSYWDSQGFSEEEKNNALREFIKPGKCFDNQKNHWYVRLFDKDGDGKVSESEVTCS